MAWNLQGNIAGPTKAVAAPGWSRLFVAGHSWAADGGASVGQKGWTQILTAMLKAEEANIAVGGAVLAYSQRNLTGDGGWAWLVNRMLYEAPEVNWRGTWANTNSYALRDGVLYSGTYYIWEGNNPTVTGGTAPVPGGANAWAAITGPNSAGASKWSPPGELLIPFYGGNDLGFHNNLTIFREALIYALSLCSAAWIYDNSWFNIVYDANWPADTATNRTTAYSATLKTIPNVNNATMTINVPADFPGGSIALRFVCSANSQGRITTTVDGAAGPTKSWGSAYGGLVVPANFGMLNGAGGTVAGQTASNVPAVLRITGLAAGAHTIVGTINNTLGAVGNIYFDGITIENSTQLPTVIFPSLFKVIDYTLWNSTYGFNVGDVDVTNWNNDIKTNVMPLFPNVHYLDIENLLNKDPQYFSYDNVHPNNAGHALLAQTAFDYIAGLNRTSIDAARTITDPTEYTNQWWPASGDTITPSCDSGLVHIINLPASGTITIAAPTGASPMGTRIKYIIGQGGNGGCKVTFTGYNLPPNIDLAPWALTSVEYVQVTQPPAAKTWNPVLTEWGRVQGGIPQRQLVGTGGGVGLAADRRAVGAITTAAVNILAAASGVTFTIGPVFYLMNTTAAAKTVSMYAGTSAIANTQFRSISVAASSGAVVLAPPLAPGDAYYLSASATGVNYYVRAYDCYEPGWVVQKTANLAAAATTTVYAPAAGKTGREGPYLANVTQGGLLAYCPSASNLTWSFTPSGGASTNISFSSAVAAGTNINGPVDMVVNSGDLVALNSSVVGVNVWALFQEF